jgi:putative tryptophan/tyrosine transport system substrate-binding protein
MKRREFITFLGGATATWPLAARAQQSTMPVIGYLDGAATSQRTEFVAAFRQGLKEAGFVEGQNVAIEFRSANGQAERLPEMAADLVRRQVAVILSTGGLPSIMAAKAASPTMPIVVVFGGDPVKIGLIASLNHPGGNITGATFVSAELAGKQLELMCQLVPSATMIAFLSQPDDRENAEAQQNSIVAAGQAQGRRIILLGIRNDGDFEDAFASIIARGAGALVVGLFPLFAGNRAGLVALAAQYKVPTIYQYREFASNGGLMSYSGRATDSFRLGGDYVGQILKGVKPADLPFQLPTKFDLVINLKTAKTLGLTIPPMLLSLADEVIE